MQETRGPGLRAQSAPLEYWLHIMMVFATNRAPALERAAGTALGACVSAGLVHEKLLVGADHMLDQVTTDATRSGQQHGPGDMYQGAVRACPCSSALRCAAEGLLHCSTPSWRRPCRSSSERSTPGCRCQT